MNIRKLDVGSDATSTFVGCWPCDQCFKIVPAGLCSDECNELLAICEDCMVDDDPLAGNGGWTIVRPDAKRKFQLLSGEEGWWSE